MNSEKNNLIRIGITGTIGVGKSLAGTILENLGIIVIDTDKIVHELLVSDDKIKTEIKSKFPTAINVLGNKEEISRKELARIIFTDKQAKTKLESILHPRVHQVCKEQILDLAENDEIKPKAVATLIPLLFEANRQADYDQIWTIYCDEDILRQRLTKRDGFSKEEIDKRLAGQLSQAEKKKLADKVLDNSKDENHLRQQILKNLKDLKLFVPGIDQSL